MEASALDCRSHLPAGLEELDGLGKPDRPRDNRRNDQTDHDRFHHHVGIHEHAPRREIARQERGCLDGRLVRRQHRAGHQDRRGCRGEAMRCCGICDGLTCQYLSLANKRTDAPGISTSSLL